MRSLALFGILVLGLLGRFGTDTLARQEQSKRAKPGQELLRQVRVKDLGCTYFDGNGNVSTVYVGNVCKEAMQFQIEWSGGFPSRVVTYRTNGQDRRDVRRLDTRGALISETPATMGLGPPTNNVRIDQQVGPGQTLLLLVNTDTHPIFVGGNISVRKNGTETRSVGLGVLIKKTQHVRVAVLLPGEQYVPTLNAEVDPD